MTIKMKLLAILTILFFNLSHGQSDLKIEKSDNSRLIKILNDSRIIAETKTTDLAIRVYKTYNEPGSAGFPNGEATNNLLIAVSEFDEYPKQNLFEIGPMYAPEFKKWAAENDLTKELLIEYGSLKNRNTITLVISISELKIKK